MPHGEDVVRWQTQAMESAMDGIAIHDAEGRFLWLNAAHARAYGYPVHALVGRSYRVLYDEAEAQRFDRDVMPALRRDGRWRGPATGRRADGSAFPQDLSLTLLEGGGLVCVVRDVSEREAAEAEARRARDRLAAVADATPVCFFTLDRAGRITDVRGGGLRLLGLSPADVVGRAATDFSRTEADRDSVARALRGERVRTRFAMGDRVLDVHYEPVEARDAGPDAVFGIAVDVTSEARAEEALRQAHALEGLKVVAGGVAHDLNNLLATILGNAALALLDGPVDGQGQVLLRRIELASRRAGELTRQLLDYTGPEGGDPVRVDVSGLVRDMTGLLESVVRKSTRIDTRTDVQLPPVSGDPTQLRQVLLNLVVNASESLLGRPGTVTILTGVRRVIGPAGRSLTRVPEIPLGTYVALEVIDTGVGVSAASRERIFDPFFTTKRDGRGLGLAVVVGVVRRHGGAVEVESEPGRGSTFRVLLPVAPGLDGPASADPVEGALWRGNGRVLVVDDEPHVREMLSDLLSRLGFRAESAGSVDEGLAACRREPGAFAAVLVDLTMPGRDGTELVRALTADDPSAPVILMSGHHAAYVRRHAGELGGQVLEKPFTLASLSEHLQRVVERARR